MMKRVLAGVAVAVMLAGTAMAGPWEDGVAAYKRGDYATALRLWRPLAEGGDRQRLRAIIADPKSLQKHVWRARIVQLSGESRGTSAIAKAVPATKTPRNNPAI